MNLEINGMLFIKYTSGVPCAMGKTWLRICLGTTISKDRLGTKSKCTYINELILKNNLLMEQDIDVEATIYGIITYNTLILHHRNTILQGTIQLNLYALGHL